MVRNSNSNGLNPRVNTMGMEKAKPEAVIDSVTLDANKQSFEIVYHPQAITKILC
jgi:hypothetical protein